jgi:hypothetical protein
VFGLLNKLKVKDGTFFILKQIFVFFRRIL